MNNKQTMKMLKEKWNKISYSLNNKSWSKYADDLLKMSLQESKSHDNFRGESIKRGISIREEALFFSVKRLSDYSYGLEKFIPDAKDYNHLQKSIFIAYGLSQEFNKEIKEIINEEEAKFISSLDYCKLIGVE